MFIYCTYLTLPHLPLSLSLSLSSFSMKYINIKKIFLTNIIWKERRIFVRKVGKPDTNAHAVVLKRFNRTP